jgi:hypothetical protein
MFTSVYVVCLCLSLTSLVCICCLFVSVFLIMSVFLLVSVFLFVSVQLSIFSVFVICLFLFMSVQVPIVSLVSVYLCPDLPFSCQSKFMFVLMHAHLLVLSECVKQPNCILVRQSLSFN